MNKLIESLDLTLNTNENLIIYLYTNLKTEIKIEVLDRSPTSNNTHLSKSQLLKLSNSIIYKFKKSKNLYLIKCEGSILIRDSLILDKYNNMNFPICIKSKNIHFFNNENLNNTSYIKHILFKTSLSSLFKKGQKLSKRINSINNISTYEFKKLICFFNSYKKNKSNMPIFIDDYFFNLGFLLGLSNSFCKSSKNNIKKGIWSYISYNNIPFINKSLSKCLFTEFIFKNFNILKNIDTSEYEIKGIFLNSFTDNSFNYNIKDIYSYFKTIESDSYQCLLKKVDFIDFKPLELNKNLQLRKFIVLDAEFIQGNHGYSYLASLGCVCCEFKNRSLKIQNKMYEFSSDMKYLPQNEVWRLKRFSQLTGLTGYEHLNILSDNLLFEKLNILCDSPNNSLFITWGNNDETVISFAEKRLNKPILNSESYIWLNLLEEFKKFYNIKNDISLKNAISYLDLEIDVNYHHALDDAIATSLILERMLYDGWMDLRLYTGLTSYFIHGKQKNSKSNKNPKYSFKKHITTTVDIDSLDKLKIDLLKAAYLIFNLKDVSISFKTLGFKLLFNQFLNIHFKENFEKGNQKIEIKIQYDSYYFYALINELTLGSLNLEEDLLKYSNISKNQKAYIQGYIYNNIKYLIS